MVVAAVVAGAAATFVDAVVDDVRNLDLLCCLACAFLTALFPDIWLRTEPEWPQGLLINLSGAQALSMGADCALPEPRGEGKATRVNLRVLKPSLQSLHASECQVTLMVN